jgi:hypothetical protein
MIIEEEELFDKEILIGGDLGYANKTRTKAITISDYGDGYKIRQYTSNGDMGWARVDSHPVQAGVMPNEVITGGSCWYCVEFEQHRNQRQGYCHKHKFDTKARIAKLIKCNGFIRYDNKNQREA